MKFNRSTRGFTYDQLSEPLHRVFQSYSSVVFRYLLDSRLSFLELLFLIAANDRAATIDYTAADNGYAEQPRLPSLYDKGCFITC